MIRIAITGPESSGKTTLALALSEALGIHCCSEYAREFLNSSKGKYSFSDLDRIALGQLALWENAIPPMICDTDLTVLKIWSLEKYGILSSLIQRQYVNQQFDHYFVCKPDIPWEPDPLREHPEDRDRLFCLYVEELKKMNRPFTVLNGVPEERLKRSREVINSLFPFFKK